MKEDGPILDLVLLELHEWIERAKIVKWVRVKSRMLVSASRENASVNTSLTMTVRTLGLRSDHGTHARRRSDDGTPSAVGRIYHDAWTPLLLRASYHVRRRYDDVEMTGYCGRVRIGQELISGV